MDKLTYITKDIKRKYEYLEKQGYEVFGVYLQGSQNYGLDVYDEDYKSDIDVKAMIIPSLRDLILNKKLVSTTIELENKEHIDIKDIRLMFDCFYKQNINFLEILFTKYKVINPKYKKWDDYLSNIAEAIVKYDYRAALNCMSGMAMQKYVALKHPYPSLVDKIEKFGYDPKQLHHIVRMKDFMEKFISGKPYSECLIPSNPKELIDIKKGKLSLEEAEKLAKETIDYVYALKDKELTDKQFEVRADIKDMLNIILEDTLTFRFKEELIRE